MFLMRVVHLIDAILLLKQLFERLLLFLPSHSPPQLLNNPFRTPPFNLLSHLRSLRRQQTLIRNTAPTFVLIVVIVIGLQMSDCPQRVQLVRDG